MKMETREKRFVVDHMLGRMARWLRLLGFDTRCERLQDSNQVEAFRREGFIIITRNRRWYTESQVLTPSSNDSMAQLVEVIAQASISPTEIKPFRRCILCNCRLESLSRDCVLGRVPDYVYETYARFSTCPGCGRIYWPGSHSRRMSDRLHRLLGWVL